jgi:trimethylamine--corrinoid protein Co-methyltransferase
MTVGIPILSPLRLTAMNAEIMAEACRRGHPIVSTICPMAGTTSPYSLAGTLALGHAENLFLAALTQLLRPGHPYLYAMGPSRTNMRTGDDMYYTLDKVLWKSAACELGKALGLPVAAECGGTMTYRYDQQSGAEGVLFMLAALRAGAHILAGIGSCFNAVGMSAEMMLIQMDWLRAARFLERGIDVGTLERDLESVRRAGPGGSFLTDEATLERLHAGGFFEGGLFDYSGACGPEPSLFERAHSRVESLVAGSRSPVPERIQEEVRRYFAGECRKLGAPAAREKRGT